MTATPHLGAWEPGGNMKNSQGQQRQVKAAPRWPENNVKSLWRQKPVAHALKTVLLAIAAILALILAIDNALVFSVTL